LELRNSSSASAKKEIKGLVLGEEEGELRGSARLMRRFLGIDLGYVR
jgi:hypothetical protein